MLHKDLETDPCSQMIAGAALPAAKQSFEALIALKTAPGAYAGKGCLPSCLQGSLPRLPPRLVTRLFAKAAWRTACSPGREMPRTGLLENFSLLSHMFMQGSALRQRVRQKPIRTDRQTFLAHLVLLFPWCSLRHGQEKNIACIARPPVVRR